MNSQQGIVNEIMTELENALDNGLPLLGSFTIVKKDTVLELLDHLYEVLPDEIKEARALLRRKDELQYEAQQRAEKMIADAQVEANRLLSESDLLRAVQVEAEKIKDQVISDCDSIKQKAYEEAEAIRTKAFDESNTLKEGASVYADKVLTNIEQNLLELHKVIKTAQAQLEQNREESRMQTLPPQDYNQSYSIK